MIFGSLIKKRGHDGVRFMLDPERDCLPQSEMTVRSMPKTLVPKGSLNGVVGIGYQLIKMIGKLTHTKEFALEVGQVVHGFSHQTSWMKGVQQSKQQLQIQRIIKDFFQEELRQLSS